MTVILCISNYFNEREYFILTARSAIELLQKPSQKKYLKQSRKTEINGLEVYYFLQEIQQFTNYRRKLCENPLLSEGLLVVKIVPPERERIDYKWNSITSRTIWEKVEVDYLMSWLSTLGGGFSALGEQFSRCAETAGKISIRQLQIGIRLGDPCLQARCKLYFSISLIQTGRLRSAKRIIREQYKFAISQKEFDGRLLKMCQGIWHRLQYEYAQRLKRNYPPLPQAP